MIESVHNPKVKKWVSYHQKKYRDEDRVFLVEGEHLVEEALKSGQLMEVMSLSERSLPVHVHVVSSAVMDKVCQTKSKSAIVGLCRKKTLKLEQKRRLLLLDTIQDPGNLGTMIRTAVSFGFDGIIMNSGCADVYNEKTIRSSQGAIFFVPVVVADLKNMIKELQSEGVIIVATALQNAIGLNQLVSSEKMAFVMGNEGQGVSEELIGLADQCVTIEMSTFESLNVGIATGIICYNFRQ